VGPPCRRALSFLPVLRFALTPCQAHTPHPFLQEQNAGHPPTLSPRCVELEWIIPSPSHATLPASGPSSASLFLHPLQRTHTPCPHPKAARSLPAPSLPSPSPFGYSASPAGLALFIVLPLAWNPSPCTPDAICLLRPPVFLPLRSSCCARPPTLLTPHLSANCPCFQSLALL
jgi:hypothetical protein